MASIEQVSGFIETTDQSVLKTVAEALQLQYQDYSLKKENVTNPISDLASYVFKAHKEGLDKREQCSYSGSILVFSTLEEMGLKYASDVDKVNKVYLAGMKLAKTIWSNLDAHDKSSPKVDRRAFEEIIQQMSDKIWVLTTAT